MNKKLFYTQPTTDLLELRVEGLVCESVLVQVSWGDTGSAGGGADYNNYPEDF